MCLRMKRTLPLIVVAIALSGAGCYSILGLGSFGNCNGGNVDVTVHCDTGGGGPGAGGPGGGGGHAPTSSSGGANGGAGGSSSSAATGGGGSQGPACSPGGNPGTVISSTEAPGAVWNSFLMVGATKSDAPVFFAVYDRVSRSLFLRGVRDLQLPDPLVVWPSGGGGDDIDIYGGGVVGTNLVLHVRSGNDLGDLVAPLQGGNQIDASGIAFTPYPAIPGGCPAPGFPKSLAVDEADGSVAYVCSDGGNPETFTLFLDGVVVASATESSKVNVVVNHKFANGKRMLLTFGQLGSYVRFGTDAASLGSASLLKLSGSAGSDIELVTPLTAKAYGPNDFVLIAADIPSSFSSYALFSGRVAGTSAALGAQPPTGLTKSFTASDVSKVLIGLRGDDDGTTIALAGASANQTDVLLDFFDKDGTALVADYAAVTASPNNILAAGAAHTGLGTALMVGWADTSSVQARNVFCSTK